jgi:hypothetical protein
MSWLAILFSNPERSSALVDSDKYNCCNQASALIDVLRFDCEPMEKYSGSGEPSPASE